MKKLSEIDSETLMDLARYAFLRIDGAWFIASAEKCGVETATDLDVKAWEIFSERFAKRIVSKLELKGDFCQVLPTVLGVQNILLNMKSKVECHSNDRAVIRVTDCEIWKMVSKVWTRETAPCYKVTQTSIRGMLKGAFPDAEFIIKQNKMIPLGDQYCEVEITRKKTS